MPHPARPLRRWPHRPLAALAIGAAALAGATLAPLTPALAAPEPDPVPTRWQFEIEPGDLRIALVRTPEGTRPYFFFTYTITNHWSTDLQFFPDLTLKTDEATLQRSGRDVPVQVQEEIKGRLNNPLVEDQIQIVGPILQGPENARTGLAVWPAEDLQVDEVTLFFAGLSGENEAYTVTRDDGTRHRFNLRKTLMLRYATPGQFGQRDNERLELVDRLWVMR